MYICMYMSMYMDIYMQYIYMHITIIEDTHICNIYIYIYIMYEIYDITLRKIIMKKKIIII